MAYYSPAVLSSVVAASIWLLMFDPRGVANQFLNFVLNTKGVDYHWLADENMLRLATIIVYFWKYVGYFTIIFVVGMASVPRSVHEAARIDGASEFGIYFRIILPNSTTALATLTVLTFRSKWDYLISSLLIVQSPEKRTNPLYIIQFATEKYTNEGAMMAAAVIASLPMFVLFFTLTKYFLSGAELFAVKKD